MTQPLALRAIRTTAVEVPMKHVLGTSAAAVRAAPLLLVDVETEEGITGHAYLFCYLPASAPGIAAILGEIERFAKGDRIAPADLWKKLAKRFTLIGVQGIVRMAMAAFDVACWDVLAKVAKQPLVTLLGGAARPIRAYNSCGLGLMEGKALAREAGELLAGGFTGVKLRLGYPTLEEDIAAVRTVRKVVGDGIALMVDYNQALSVADALLRGRALDAEGIYWLEEPIRHDDYRGNARLARELSTPIQIGENFSLPFGMEEALAHDACDFAMPDLERIGGVTGWMAAAALAKARGIEMSSHLFPEASAHLLAATPTAHWLEYVDWAAPILEQPIEIRDGNAVIPDRPGNGLAWNREAVDRLRIR
jgi:mandelate racemase